MKKELFAAGLLALILAFSILNTAVIDSICEGVTDLIDRSTAAAREGNWEESELLLNDALSLWKKNETYTTIVLRHTDIDTVSDDFYEFTEHVYSQDAPSARAAASLIREHLESVKKMERMCWGSIF